MYLFAVIGFFAAFLAFMKFGSNDFGISSGKEQPKGPKTFWYKIFLDVNLLINKLISIQI